MDACPNFPSIGHSRLCRSERETTDDAEPGLSIGGLGRWADNGGELIPLSKGCV